MEAVSIHFNTDSELEQRISRMHARDRAGLIAFVLVLWCTLLFTIISIWSYISVPAIQVILVTAGSFVLALNSAAVLAMLRHYDEDRHFIYGLDLKHLDEMRQRRS